MSGHRGHPPTLPQGLLMPLVQTRMVPCLLHCGDLQQAPVPRPHVAHGGQLVLTPGCGAGPREGGRCQLGGPGP